jgi:hypothetical protein
MSNQYWTTPSRRLLTWLCVLERSFVMMNSYPVLLTYTNAGDVNLKHCPCLETVGPTVGPSTSAVQDTLSGIMLSETLEWKCGHISIWCGVYNYNWNIHCNIIWHFVLFTKNNCINVWLHEWYNTKQRTQTNWIRCCAMPGCHYQYGTYSTFQLMYNLPMCIYGRFSMLTLTYLPMWNLGFRNC